MIFIFALLFSGYVAADSYIAANGKLDAEVHLISSKYKQEGLPSKNVDAWWVMKGNKFNPSLLSPGVPRQYRHLHAMVVAAFYAKRADHRNSALQWLEEYSCENPLACEEEFSYLDSAIKATVLNNNSSFKQRVSKVRDALEVRMREVSLRLPKTNGLCGPDVDRAAWVSMGYQLFCPAYRVGVAGGGCGALAKESTACSDTKALSWLIELRSHQLVMSAHYLDSFQHLGGFQCDAPWEVKLKCGGAIAATYTLRCERKGKTYPLDIDCKEIARK